MRKVSILIPHYRTPRLTATCIWHFKQYGVPVDSEIIVADNTPDHWGIRALTDTELGQGVKVVSGRLDFPSHGEGYWAAYHQSDGDWIFTGETDAWPTRHGWFDEYLKASVDYDLIGPEIPQSSGPYIHPAGSLVSRNLIESARQWQKDNWQWVFVPSAAVCLGTSDRAFHIVAKDDFLAKKNIPEYLASEIKRWRDVGVWQEQRSFELGETFDNYGARTKANFTPTKDVYNRIGWEAGQWLAYYAQAHGFKCLKAPVDLHWMNGHVGKQAAYSTVFGGFIHLWAGTASTVAPKDFAQDVVSFKRAVIDDAYAKLPEKLRNQIDELEREHSTP